MSEIRCQFIILARKSGVSCPKIRCQFIILARKDEPTPDYARDLVEGRGYRLMSRCGEIRCQFIILARKSGVSSSFLPEKMNRHPITRGTSSREGGAVS